MTDQANTIPTYEINKELVLSTAHIQQETSGKLDDLEVNGVIVYNFEYGHRLHINLGEHETRESYKLALTNCSVPSELIEIMLIAYDFKCKWLLLDQDGPIMENLKDFPW